MDPQVIDLLAFNIAVLKDELALLETGIVKCESRGVDVTPELDARLRANLARLEAIIAAEALESI